MNIYNMKMEQFQVNTQFLNSLPPEWSKFLTDVKLVKDFHTTNFDLFHAYLEQHELHANEVCLLREVNQDPLAFVVNQQMTPSHFNTYQSSYNIPQLQQPFSPSQYGSCFTDPVFSLRDDPIGCLNKAMAFLTDIASLRQGQSYSGTGYNSNATSSRGTMQVERQELLNATTVNTEDLDTYDFECDDILNAKAVLIANISNYGSDLISE
nr:hypothetical protein [Tanacetum cinerariifolium]